EQERQVAQVACDRHLEQLRPLEVRHRVDPTPRATPVERLPDEAERQAQGERTDDEVAPPGTPCLQREARPRRPYARPGLAVRPRLGVAQLALRAGLDLHGAALREAEAVRDAGRRLPGLPAVLARVYGGTRGRGAAAAEAYRRDPRRRLRRRATPRNRPHQPANHRLVRRAAAGGRSFAWLRQTGSGVRGRARRDAPARRRASLPASATAWR